MGPECPKHSSLQLQRQGGRQEKAWKANPGGLSSCLSQLKEESKAKELRLLSQGKGCIARWVQECYVAKERLLLEQWLFQSCSGKEIKGEEWKQASLGAIWQNQAPHFRGAPRHERESPMPRCGEWNATLALPSSTAPKQPEMGLPEAVGSVVVTNSLLVPCYMRQCMCQWDCHSCSQHCCLLTGGPKGGGAMQIHCIGLLSSYSWPREKGKEGREWCDTYPGF